MNELPGSDMLGIIAVLKKWRRPIISLVIVATVIASIVAILLPKKYSSTAVVFPVNSMLADKSRLFNSNIQQLYSEYGGSDDLDHLYAIVSSYTVFGFITDSFHLIEHYRINGVPEKARDVAVKRLKKNTDIIKSENGELRIEVWDKDNKMAADIANAMLYKIQSISKDIMWQANIATLNALRKDQSQTITDTGHIARSSGPALSTERVSFDKEIRELEVSLDAAPPVFVVLEKPVPSFEAGKPRIWMIIVGTFLLSAFFAIIAALIAERSKR